MLILRLSPGLANQMYEYASGYALAKELGEELVLDISECANSSRGYLLDYFNIPDVRKLLYSQISVEAEAHLNCDSALRLLGNDIVVLVENAEAKKRYASEQRVIIYTGLDMAESLRKYEKKYMCGYFFNRYVYYKKYWDEIRGFFSLKEENKDIQDFKKMIANKVSVGIHIRRGDMLLAEWSIKLEDDYFRAAIQYCRERLDECIFCVFSDDIQYAKEILGEDKSIHYIHFSGYNNAVLSEFICLSLCDHRILSNSSTFGRMADDLNWGKERHVFTKYVGEVEIDTPLYQRSLEREIKLTEKDIKKYSSKYLINEFENNEIVENSYNVFLKLLSESRNHEALQLAFCIYVQNMDNIEFTTALSEVLIRTGFYEESIVELARIGILNGSEQLHKIILDKDKKNELERLFTKLTSINRKHFIIVLLKPMPTGRTYGLIDLGIILTHLGHRVTFIYEPCSDKDNYYLQNSRKFYNKEGVDLGSFHYSKSEVLSQGITEFYNQFYDEELYIISRDHRFFVRIDEVKKLIFITTDVSDVKDGETIALAEDENNLKMLYEKADIVLTKDERMSDKEKYVYWQDKGKSERFFFVETQWKYGYQQRLNVRLIGMAEALCEKLGENKYNTQMKGVS